MSSRAQRVCIGVGVVVLVLIISGVLVSHWVNSSSNGSVRVGTASSSATAAAPQPISIRSSYFTSQLPAGFTMKPTSPTGQGALWRMVATSAGTTSQQTAITIGSFPVDGLSGIGDYNLRHTQTSQYAPYTLPDSPAGAVSFHSLDTKSVTIFWPHSTYYAEITASSDTAASENELAKTVAYVVAQWKWL